MFSLACHSFALSDCCHWAPFEFNACCQRALLLCGGKQGYAEAACMYAYLKHPLWGQILNCLLSQRKLVIHNVRWRLCQCLMILSNSEMSARVAEQMQTLMSVFLSGKKNRKKEIVRANLNLMYSFYKIHTHTHTHTDTHTHTAPANPLSMHLFIAVKTLDLAKYLPHVHVEDWTGNPEALSASRPSCHDRMDPRKEEVSMNRERKERAGNTQMEEAAQQWWMMMRGSKCIEGDSVFSFHSWTWLRSRRQVRKG